MEVAQKPPSVSGIQRVRRYPETHLVVVETGLEKRHNTVGQVDLTVVEITEMTPPSDLPDAPDSCIALLGHRGTPWLMAAARGDPYFD